MVADKPVYAALRIRRRTCLLMAKKYRVCNMAQDWFILSLNDGSLERVKAPAESKPVKWIERDLENLLALNPNFLGVADHLPLRLRGVRGTVTSPDQAFIDELGRVAVVEVKKIRASLPVISQVMAYANHWQLLPPREIGCGLQEFSGEVHGAEKLGQALFELQAWAEEEPEHAADASQLRSLGKRVLGRLNANWARRPVTSINAFAQQHWGRDQLPCVGAPPRMIAVAPGFSDECIDFAEQLTQRMVGIELVAVEIVKARGRIYVGREQVHRDPASEPTWRLLRDAWRLQPIRDHFVVNGWADALNRESFSLSARDVPEVRFWIWASDSETSKVFDASVWTVVPDGWHSTNSLRRKELREQFLDALPKDVDRTQRWLEWEFELPRQERDVTECILKMAEALIEVLIPAAPR